MEDGYRTCEVVISPERNIKKTNVTVSQNGHEAQATVKHKNATTIIQVKHGEKFVKADLVIVTSSKKPPPASSTFRIPAADIVEVTHLFTTTVAVSPWIEAMKTFVESKKATWAGQDRGKCRQISSDDASSYHVHSTSLETCEAIAKEMRVKLGLLANAAMPTDSGSRTSDSLMRPVGMWDDFPAWVKKYARVAASNKKKLTRIFVQGTHVEPFVQAALSATKGNESLPVYLTVQNNNTTVTDGADSLSALRHAECDKELCSNVHLVVVVGNDLGILVDDQHHPGRLFSQEENGDLRSHYHRFRFGRSVENYLVPLCAPLHLLRRSMNHDPTGSQVAFDFCSEVLLTLSKNLFSSTLACGMDEKALSERIKDCYRGHSDNLMRNIGDAVVPDVFTATAVLRLNNLLEVDDPEKMVKLAQEILALLDKENFKEERNNIGNIAALKDDCFDDNSSKVVAEAAARKLADLKNALPEFFKFSSSPGVGDGRAVARFPPSVLGKGESPRGLDLPSLLAKCTQQYHRLYCLQEGLPLSDESEKPQGGKKVAASSAAGGPEQKDTEGSKLTCQVIARFLFLVQDQYLALFRTPHKGKPIGGKFSMTKALFRCTAKGCSCSEVLRLAPDFSRCACCRHKISAHDGWFKEEAKQYEAKNLEWCAATNFYLALCLCAPLMWDSHPYMQAMRGEQWLGEREVKAQNQPLEESNGCSQDKAELIRRVKLNMQYSKWLEAKDQPAWEIQDFCVPEQEVNAEMKQWIEKVLNTQTNLLSNAPSSVSQAWWELTQNRQEELKGLCSLLRDHNPEDAAPVAGGGNST